MRSTFWVSFVFLAVLISPLLSDQPFLRVAMGAESRLLSLNASGEPLGEVLRKISKDTGYRISTDSEWAGLPVSVSFKNLPMNQGLRRILARLNHSIVFNDAEKRISIVIKSLNNSEEFPTAEVGRASNDSPPGALQSTNVPLENIKDAGHIQVIPPMTPGESGLTLKQLEEMNVRSAKFDSGSIEITPPHRPGEKGVTLKEIEAQQTSKRAEGLMDMNPVPPDSVGHN